MTRSNGVSVLVTWSELSPTSLYLLWHYSQTLHHRTLKEEGPRKSWSSFIVMLSMDFSCFFLVLCMCRFLNNMNLPFRTVKSFIVDFEGF
jgi:sensor histidine kinase YesM